MGLNLRGGLRHWTRDGLLLVLAPHPESPPQVGLVAYLRTQEGALEREGRVFELPPEPRPVGFEVFAADGRLLGRPNTKAELARIRIVSITATSIYGIDTDELGVNQVVRLEIQHSGVGSAHSRHNGKPLRSGADSPGQCVDGVCCHENMT